MTPRSLPPAGRVRAPRGGRNPVTETDPGLGAALRSLWTPRPRRPRVAARVDVQVDRNLADALIEAGKNNGREYQPTGSMVKVNGHDFADPEPGKAIPFGIYERHDEKRLSVRRRRPRHIRVRRGHLAPQVDHRLSTSGGTLPRRRPVVDLG